MADPKTPYVIAVTCTSAANGDTLTIRNRNTEEKIVKHVDANANAVIDIANLSTDYANNDIIELLLTGSRTGGSTHTVNTAHDKATSITITSIATNTSTEGINI